MLLAQSLPNFLPPDEGYANSNYGSLKHDSKVNLANAATSEEDHKKRPIETTDCFVQDCFINRPDFEILQLGIFTCKAKKKKVSLGTCRTETTLAT